MRGCLPVHDALRPIGELHRQDAHRQLCVHVVRIDRVESVEDLGHEIVCALAELVIGDHDSVDHPTTGPATHSC